MKNKNKILFGCNRIVFNGSYFDDSISWAYFIVVSDTLDVVFVQTN